MLFLQIIAGEQLSARTFSRRCSSGVEHVIGNDEVEGSNPSGGFVLEFNVFKIGLAACPEHV